MASVTTVPRRFMTLRFLLGVSRRNSPLVHRFLPVEDSKDGFGQVARGCGGELDRHPRRRTVRRASYIDVQRVVGKGVRRVIEVDAGVSRAEPAGLAFRTAGYRERLGHVGAHLSPHRPIQEAPDAVPAVESGFDA